MYQGLGSCTRKRFSYCTNLTQLVERSPTHSEHRVPHGQCAVDQYSQIFDVRLKQHCTSTKVHRLDVDFFEIEGTSQPDELRLVCIQFKSVRRHPFIDLINAVGYCMQRQEMPPNLAPHRNKADRRQRRNECSDDALMQFLVCLQYKAETRAVRRQNLAERQT